MDLAGRFVRGDLDAFETLFRRFEWAVFRWVLRIVRDRAAAEELTVETFWRIYRARARFDPARDFEPWARRIATNLALSHLARDQARQRRDVPLVDAAVDVGRPDLVDRLSIRRAVARAVAELPARDRVIVVLSLVEDRSNAEIAEALDISEGAVRVRKMRALRRLEMLLARWGIGP